MDILWLRKELKNVLRLRKLIKIKKSKEPNPVVIDGDSDMSKPVRGLN